MKPAITALAYALPENRLTHSELCERFGKLQMGKVAESSGIFERRIADAKTCASDLAFEAAELLFKNSKKDRAKVDLLIFATQTPDYLLPTTACILQKRLGLSKNIAAFDINLGCTQFTYALAQAHALIKSGLAKKALVLSADTITKTINPKDRSAASIFGDAAVAALVENSASGGFQDFVFGTDGGGYKDLILPTSGFRNPPEPADFIESSDADGNIRSNANLYVNGIKVFSFAYKVLYNSVSELLKKNSLGVEDIDMFIFHQAGEKIIKSASERLGIPNSKIHFKLHDIGNCGGASVGIALADAYMNNRIKPDMKIVLSSFGVGLSWCGILMDFSKDFKGAWTLADFSKSPQRPVSQG